MTERPRDLSYLATQTEFRPIRSCPWCGSERLESLATRGDGLPVKRCAKCGLGFLAELPADLSVFYDADYFTRNPGSDVAFEPSGYNEYERTLTPFGFRWLAMLIRSAIGPHRSRLFDMGAATGTFLEITRCEGFDVQGSELIPAGAEAARDKGLDVRTGPFRGEDWAEGSFDVVTALEVLEHVRDIRSTLTELGRLVSDGGLLVFFVPTVPAHLVERYGDAAMMFNKSYEHTLYLDAGSLHTICQEVFGQDRLTLLEGEGDEQGQTVCWALGFVRKGAAPNRPERRLFTEISGAGGSDPDMTEYEAQAVALSAAKFGRFASADVALARAAALGAEPTELAMTKAQVLRQRGELFAAMEVLDTAPNIGLAAPHTLRAFLIAELVEDFLSLLGIEESGLADGMREMHRRYDQAQDWVRYWETRSGELADREARTDQFSRTLGDAIAEIRRERRRLYTAAIDAEARADARTRQADARTRKAESRATQAETRATKLEARVKRLTERLDAAQAKLESITGSRAWTAVSRYRRVVTAFRGIPSRRRGQTQQDPADDAPSTVEETDVVSGRAPTFPVSPSYPVTVSVIMPVFNKGATLRSAIESVLSQTLSSVELVVWDDGSTDAATLSALKEVGRLEGVTVFHGENQGVVGARNSAMEVARGEFFACLDPDDAFAPTYLEKAVALLRARPGVSIAYPWQRTVGGKEEIWETRELTPSVIARANTVPVSAMFRREVFVHTEGFSASMEEGFEDWEFWAHAAALGFGSRVIPEPLFEYTWSDDAGASRDAAARAMRRDLAGKIRTLHPELGRIASRSEHEPGAPDVLVLDPPRLPAGSGRPIVLTLPWFTVGGADRMVESLIEHWTAAGRTVVALTTHNVDGGMTDRFGDLLDLTPFAYNLPALLPQHLWQDLLDGVLDALSQPVIVNVGSAWLRHQAPAIKAAMPEVRIIDQQFNAVGHVRSNIEAGDAIDVTVVAYQELGKELAKMGRNPKTIETVHVGIQHQPVPTRAEIASFRSKIGLDGNRDYVAFIGRLSKEKRPQWLAPLADALAEVDTDLVVVGTGPLAKELAPGFTHRANIVWVDGVDSVAPVYAGAKLTVLPSRVEGIPLTVMESLAAGTPVVATAVGGLPELEGTPGLALTAPDDIDDWIDATLAFLTEENDAIALPSEFNAAAMTERFDAIVDRADRP